MKRVILALAILSLVALAANAQFLTRPTAWTTPWPWGTDCTEWIWQGGTPYSVEAVYNPVNGEFYECGSILVVWPTLTIELFIEWEINVNYPVTAIQVHMASFYDSVEVIFPGGVDQKNHISSNSPARFQLIPKAGYNMGFLNWITPVVQGYTGTNCPITSWQIKVDTGSWVNMGVVGGDRYYDFASCDHDFWIKFKIDPAYHQASGYYKLQIELCPQAPI